MTKGFFIASLVAFVIVGIIGGLVTWNLMATWNIMFKFIMTLLIGIISAGAGMALTMIPFLIYFLIKNK